MHFFQAEIKTRVWLRVSGHKTRRSQLRATRFHFAQIVVPDTAPTALEHCIRCSRFARILLKYPAVPLIFGSWSTNPSRSPNAHILFVLSSL